MQTIYLLKDCIRSCNALFKLYKKPDISTNIIIVSKKQSKILLLDKRVREFPFIVNSLPTNIGLIPKYSRVLPLQLFITLKKKYNNLKKQKPQTIKGTKPIKKLASKCTIKKDQDGSVEISI